MSIIRNQKFLHVPRTAQDLFVLRVLCCSRPKVVASPRVIMEVVDMKTAGELVMAPGQAERFMVGEASFACTAE